MRPPRPLGLTMTVGLHVLLVAGCGAQAPSSLAPGGAAGRPNAPAPLSASSAAPASGPANAGEARPGPAPSVAPISPDAVVGNLSVHLTGAAPAGGLVVLLVDTVTQTVVDRPKALLAVAPASGRLDWLYEGAAHPLRLFAYAPTAAGCAGPVAALDVAPQPGDLGPVAELAVADLLASPARTCADLPGTAASSALGAGLALTLKAGPQNLSFLAACPSAHVAVTLTRYADRKGVATRTVPTGAGLALTFADALVPGQRYLIGIAGLDARSAPLTAAACQATYLTAAVAGDLDLALPERAATYAAANPSCTVTAAAELEITALSVVDDPLRTAWTGSRANPSDGAWSLGRLLSDVAGSQDGPSFVAHWLAELSHDTPVNGLVAAGNLRLADHWPTAHGLPDLTQAPVHLLAIANRIDLRNPAAGSLGELRFVFGTLPQRGQIGLFANDFKVILEYTVPASASLDADGWANGWHLLASLTGNPAAYNAQLERLSRTVTQSGGPVQMRIRTAEESDGVNWSFRQFDLGADGLLHSAGLALTPDSHLNALSDPNAAQPADIAQNAALAAFIDANADAILNGTYTVPSAFAGIPLLAATSTIFVDYVGPKAARDGRSLTFYPQNQVHNRQALATFTVNTCNGCHGLQVSPAMIANRFDSSQTRALGGELPQPAALAPFLIGGPTPLGTFNDLERRREGLQDILCAGAGNTAGAAVVFLPEE